MALTKCPDCGSDVSTVAPACPKCGRPIAEVETASDRPRRTSSTNVLGAVAVVIGILVFVGYCATPDSTSTTTASSVDQSVSQDDTASSSPDESRPIQTYTARQLYVMFHANEIKANQTIGNAIVRFTGTISSIQQSDFSTTPELDIRATCFVSGDCDDPNAWNTFRADLKESEVSSAAELKIGQMITLQCDKVSMPVDVYAEDCVIVPATNAD